MSGVRYGNVKGRLSAEFTGLLHPADMLRFRPEFTPMLEEIKKEGWSYLFIETKGKSLCEFDVDQRYLLQDDGDGYFIQIRLGETPPPVTGISEVIEFRINISTQSFPRAATVELSQGVVTYFHDPFWNWKEEWKDDPLKLSQATEVYKVAKWLLDVKQMKIREDIDVVRLKTLVQQFDRLTSRQVPLATSKEVADVQ